MKRHLITFGGMPYDATTAITVRDAPKFGVDKVLVYDDKWLREQEFYTVNRWLFDLPGVRGVCWFAWKPFIILDAMKRMSDGDVVLFVDGDTYPIGDLTPLYDRCVSESVMLFAAQGCFNRQWVKADCWITMAAEYQTTGRRHVSIESQHAVARFMLFQRGHYHVQQFLNEWLTYCLNPRSTTFDPSVWDKERKGFEQHRTEQAILSLLAHKYGYRLYREACQFGDAALALGVDAWYPTLFHQVGSFKKDDGSGSKYRNV